MRIIRMAALAAAAIFCVAASGPSTNWLSKIAVMPGGSHLLGNPQASVKLVEYISYTCPHCAHFQQQADTPLRLNYVMPGKVSVEVRHLVRDPVDLTVALLTNCGAPVRFFRNHQLFLNRQEDWIKPLYTANSAQKQRWTSGDMRTRLRAIANDFGFFSMMEELGYSRPAADRCLTDQAMADRLSMQTKDAEKLGVAGTPSFLLDGILLTGTHDWASVRAQLEARF